MLPRIFKPLALSAVLVTASLVATTAADAGGRHHHRHGKGGNFAVGAIIGLTAGAIIGGIAADNHARRHRHYNSAPPPYRPRSYRRSVTVYDEYEPEYYEYKEDYNDPPYRNYGSNRYERRDYRGYDGRSTKRRSTERRSYSGNSRQASYGAAPRPWTDAWYRYCAKKYRSFDPNSGTFQPYEGRRRMCR